MVDELLALCARVLLLQNALYYFCTVVSGNYPSVQIPSSVPSSIQLYVGNKMLVKHPQGTD